MTRARAMIQTVAALLAGCSLTASAGVFTFTSAGGSIPDYVETFSTLDVQFNVSGLDNSISYVTISLNNFAGASMPTVNSALYSPEAGTWATLCNGSGPLNASGTFVFDPNSLNVLSSESPASGGTFLPSNYDGGSNDFYLFSGMSAAVANGVWTLSSYETDDLSNAYSFESATLTIVTVPEPTVLALGALGGLVLLRRRSARPSR